MMKCDLCGIDISGRHSACPLCGSALSGLPAPSPFPPNTLEKTSRKAQMALGVISLVLILAATLACALLRAPLGIIATAGIALTVNYLFVRNILLHSPSFFKSVIRYFIVIIAVAYVWYATTGNPHAIDYVIPAVSVTSLAFNSVLMILPTRRFVGPHSKYVLFNMVIGLLPLAFFAAGAINDPALSLLDIASSAITGVIFCLSLGKSLPDELRRLLQH